MKIVRSFLALMLFIPALGLHAADPQIIELWPDRAPGEKDVPGEEKDMTKPSDGLVAGKPVIRLGNVSKPSLSLYRPPTGKDTGAAVLVCHGGAYNILALISKARRFAGGSSSIGVTAALLGKYRVPKRRVENARRPSGRPARLQPAPSPGGTLARPATARGARFSAGAHLRRVEHDGGAFYPSVDAAEPKPTSSFTVLIYRPISP
jgi:hypothetical protein